MGAGGLLGAGPAVAVLAVSATYATTTSGFHLGPVPGDPVAASAQAAAEVVGRFGLVRSCEEVRLAPGVPEVHIRVANGPRRAPDWTLSAPIEGTGVSTDPDEAAAAAIAEAVERYAATAPVPAALVVRASARDLGAAAVEPATFSLLSDAQYRSQPRLRPFTEATTLDWRPAFSLTEHRSRLVPVVLAHLAHSRQHPNNVVVEVTTTGTACHVSLPQAVLAGLCEALERDALTVAWRNRLPHVAIDPTGSEIDELLDQRFDRCHLNFQLFVVPSSSPFPVVLALAWGADGAPYATVGAACRPDPVAAARRALLEVSQVISRLRSRPPQRPARIRSFSDHADLFATGASEAEFLRGLLGQSDPVRLVDLPVSDACGVDAVLQFGVDALAAAGLEVVVVELTTADVAATGYRVVRVMVPGLVDMNADERWPRLGGRRLYQLPLALGLRDRALSEEEINLAPVPLA